MIVIALSDLPSPESQTKLAVASAIVMAAEARFSRKAIIASAAAINQLRRSFSSEVSTTIGPSPDRGQRKIIPLAQWPQKIAVDDASVWTGSVLRGDLNKVTVGVCSNVQERSVPHGACSSPSGLSVEKHEDEDEYVDLPKPQDRKSSYRKPYPTPMKVLIRRAKEEKEARKAQPCRMLEHAPDNGLLVPHLVHVAHSVCLAWNSLRFGIPTLLNTIPIKKCRFCFEVHIGHVGHEIRTCSGAKSGFRSATHSWRKGGVRDVVFFPQCYHLYDRVGKPRVVHEEKYVVPRIPAVLELCIQAGVDIEKYPSKRRTKPVYSIEGRIVDFESTEPDVEACLLAKTGDNFVKSDFRIELEGTSRSSFLPKVSNITDDELRKVSIRTLDSWLEMVSGTKKLMEKYTVQTCGYCPEVQVGPKGHKVRICRASKHQSRNGLHAWQEATIDDLVGPNHVWHVRDLKGPPLDNKLKRYYGKVPAVVELCVQAGAPIPDQYRSMMRLDVVPPDRDEVDLVA